MRFESVTREPAHRVPEASARVRDLFFYFYREDGSVLLEDQPCGARGGRDTHVCSARRARLANLRDSLETSKARAQGIFRASRLSIESIYIECVRRKYLYSVSVMALEI